MFNISLKNKHVSDGLRKCLFSKVQGNCQVILSVLLVSWEPTWQEALVLWQVKKTNIRNTPKILFDIGYHALLLQNEEIIHTLVSIGDL